MSDFDLKPSIFPDRPGMPFQFFNIITCNPGQEEELARQIVAVYEKTGIDTPLYSLTLHPEGFPASAKAEYLVESYRKLRKALEGTPIRLGVLIQSILGHWERVDKDEEPWTRSVNCEGGTPRFCPSDPEFRKYIFNTVVLLAKENPSFILSDDDVRSFSHKAECFCTLHTAEFNRRTGHNFTPEEYRQAVCNSAIGDEIFTAFEKLRCDTVDGVVALIREAIDSVNPQIPSGICMSGDEMIFLDSTARAMAGKNHPPVMRLGNSMYLEGSPKFLPYNILQTQALRDFYRTIPLTLDESDTFPHNLYSRSARSMHAKLGTSIFCGVRGSKLWFVGCKKFGKPISPLYTEVLAKYRNWYQVLAAEVADSTSCGVALPCFRKPYLWHPVNARRVPETQLVPRPQQSWAESMLGLMGIPFHAEFDYSKDQISILGGKESVERMSDAELRELLSHKVLIDGKAAAALTTRGFSKYTGVTAELEEFRYNQESDCVTGSRLPMTKSPDVPHFKALDPKAEVLSELYYAPFHTSPDREKVAPSTVYFENESGGKIITTAFHPELWYSARNEARMDWLIAMLEKLNGKMLLVTAAEYNPCTLLCRQQRDAMLLQFILLGFDPLESVHLRFAKIPQSVEFLTPEGTWRKVDFTVDGHLVTLPLRLECYESAVFRVK